MSKRRRSHLAKSPTRRPTQKRWTSLPLAIVCLVIAYIAGLNDWYFAQHWSEPNLWLAELPALTGLVFALAVFAWFATVPTFGTIAYVAVGGKPMDWMRRTVDALLEWFGPGNKK